MVRMMGFTREELAQFAGETVDDLLGPEVALLFVGINPGLWTAATRTHFCHPSNRFYPAMRLAGLIDLTVDPDIGMTNLQRKALTDAGVGITNLVSRATIRASDLRADELREGGIRVERMVDRLRPAVVAFAGITAYRTAYRRPASHLGPQPEGMGGSELWVVPNPSGLNAHETIESLADWYRAVGRAAGIV